MVSRCFPGGYNVKLYISRSRLAWWLLAFLCCVCYSYLHHFHRFFLPCQEHTKRTITNTHNVMLNIIYLSFESHVLSIMKFLLSLHGVNSNAIQVSMGVYDKQYSLLFALSRFKVQGLFYSQYTRPPARHTNIMHSWLQVSYNC